MPPKKGGKGGGKGGKRPPMVIDGVDTAEMTRERLEQFTLRVKEELDREREERNYFQMERDKIRTFWEITRTQLDEARADLRNRERATEEAEEHNDELLETEKQKIKHLQYEQQAAAAALRAESLVALKAAKEDHAQQEAELMNDKRALREQIREMKIANQDEVRRLKLSHAEELSNARKEFQDKAKEIENKAEARLQETKVELTVKHRTELQEVEERKNKQLSDLIGNHEKAFNDLKNYYNDITLNNLGLINSMKLQMEEMQKAKERADKSAADAWAEVKRLKEPLEVAIAENKELSRQMSNYARDKAALAAKSKQLTIVQKQLEVLKWEYEVIQLRFDKMEDERNELRSRFTIALKEVQKKCAYKTVLLEAKIDNYPGMGLDKYELQELLRVRDAEIEELKYQLSRLVKAHDDLLTTYEAKMAKKGIPKTELGFKALKSLDIIGTKPVLGRGPAGLVAKNQ